MIIMGNIEDKDNFTGKLPDPQLVEFYHDMGWMPDRYYYQLNGKSAQENYADQKRKMQHRLMNLMNESSSDVHISSEVKIKR